MVNNRFPQLIIFLLITYLCVGSFMLVNAIAPTFKIRTVAGGVGAGDGLHCLNALISVTAGNGILNLPNSGDFVIADQQRIRKIFSNGTITTIAGTGETTLGTDSNTIAKKAVLRDPQGLAVTSSGEVLFVEQGFVKKIQHDGKLEIVAGAGVSNPSCTDGTIATHCPVRYISGVAVSSTDEVYIVDLGDKKIRKVVNGLMTTFAGTGASGYTGDGSNATLATFKTPFSITIANDEIYITDTESHTVRKIFINGTITTIAGTGTSGSGADNILGVNSALNNPYATAVLPDGDILIVERANHRVRRLFSNGTITTIAGRLSASTNGENGPAKSAYLNYPSGVAYLNGEIYISDKTRIVKIDSNNILTRYAGLNTFIGDGLKATEAQLNAPKSMTVTPTGDIYIAESVGQRIRVVNSTTGIISTLCGDGVDGTGVDGPISSFRTRNPNDIVFSPSGQLLFADTYSGQIKKIENNAVSRISGTHITSGADYSYFSGDGLPATSARISRVFGFSIKSDGEIVLADYHNHRIRKVSPDGIITTIVGNGTSGTSDEGIGMTMFPLQAVHGINGDIYFFGEDRYLRKLWTNGTITTIKYIYQISAIAIDSDNAFIYYTAESKLSKMSLTDFSVTQITNGGQGSATNGPAINSKLNTPSYISVASNGDIYIADKGNHAIRKISNGILSTVIGTGTYGLSLDGVEAKTARVENPTGVIGLPNGDFYFTEWGNHAIRKVTNGTLQTLAGVITTLGSVTGFNGEGEGKSVKLVYPAGLFLHDGYIYFNEQARIRKVSVNGGQTSTVVGGFGDGGLSINARFYLVKKVAYSPSGDMYVLDYNFVWRVFPNDTVVKVVGTGVEGYNGDGIPATEASLYYPASIAISPLTGELYIADYQNSRVRKVFSNGTITTVVGTGVYGSPTENALATESKISYPAGVAFLSSGELLVSDKNYRKLLMVKKDGRIKVLVSGGSFSLANDEGTALITDTYISPENIFVTPEDVIYFVDGNRIRRLELQCQTGYKVSNGDCVPTCFGLTGDSACGGVLNGNCTAPDTCKCAYGKFGSACQIHGCFGISSQNSTVCSGSGSCSKQDECTCNANKYGQRCEINVCFGKYSNESLVCSGRGTCSSLDTCDCKGGAIGLQCEVPGGCNGLLSFDPKVCSTHGKCVDGSCVCDETYFGDDCQYLKCNGKSGYDSTVCSSSGQCLNGSCVCNNTSYGNDCQFRKCNGKTAEDSTVCSSSGQCLNGTCVCTPSTYGNDCQYLKCNGKTAEDLTVCSSNGKCLSGNCVCNSTNYGNNCQFLKCNGKTAEDTAVCSSSGSCVNGNCVCNSTKYGNDCQFLKCNGKTVEDVTVCSSNGKCLNGNCVCNETNYGNDCQFLKCNGKTVEDSTVCSSRGLCSNGKCTCNDNSYGYDCQNLKCNGKTIEDVAVCSSNGKCLSGNCVCNETNYGNDCQFLKCNGKTAEDTTVCSSNGVCSNGKCTCNDNSYGNDCQFLKCNGKTVEDVTVCSSNGKCLNGNCVCNSTNYGNDCQLLKCNGKTAEDSTTCSSNGKCLTNNGTCICNEGAYGNDCQYMKFTCFGKQVSNPNVCSGRGTCIEMDTCSCFSFNNNTRIKGVECERLSCISKDSTFILSTISSVCSANGECTLNGCKCFDGYSGNYCETIKVDENVKPTARISTVRSEFGSCEEIQIDASSSFSVDKKQLNYLWSLSIQPIGSNINLNDINTSILKLGASVSSGSYKVKLIVQNSETKLESEPIYFEFTKSSKALPVISIAELNNLIVKVTDVPLLIRQFVTLPECFPNTTKLDIVWTQQQGNSVYQIVDNDLVISSFPVEASIFNFQVTVKSRDDPSVNSNASISITTVEEPFTIVIYNPDLTTEEVTIEAEITPSTKLASLNKQDWAWTCYDPISESSCGQTIDGILKLASTDRSTSIKLPATTSREIQVTLKIKQTLSNDLNVKFPEAAKIPPLINLISTNPIRSSLLLTETLSIQLSVSLNGIEDGIGDLITRKWLLNGNSVSGKTSKMTVDPSLSNSILLDMNSLTEGNSYTISFEVVVISSKISATYSYTFNVARSPQPCKCTFTPSEGFALDTSFAVSCPNCITLTNTLEFGIIEEKTKARIPLYSQSSAFSTSLLSTIDHQSTRVYTKVVDSSTGAFSEYIMTVPVTVPLLKSKKEISLQKSKWDAFSKTLPSGSPQAKIFNSASISATIDLIMDLYFASLGRRSQVLSGNSVQTCLNGGVLNEVTKICKCPTGYFKIDCSMKEEEFLTRSELRRESLEGFLSSFESRSKLSPLSSQIVSLQVYGLESFMSKYDELDTGLMIRSLGMVKDIVSSALSNKNCILESGIDQLLSNILNSYYGFSVYNNTVTSMMMNELVSVTSDVSLLNLRTKLIGESSTISTRYALVKMNQYYPNELSQLSIKGIASTNNPFEITLPSKMTQNIEGTIEKRKPITIQTTSTVMEKPITIFNTSTLNVISPYQVSLQIINMSLKKSMNDTINYSVHYESTNKVWGVDELVNKVIEGDFERHTYQKSELKCLTDQAQIDNSCQAQIISDSQAICKCSKLTSVGLGQLITTSTSLVPIDPNTNNPPQYEYLALLTLIIVPIVIFIVIGVVVFVCFSKKKESKKSEKEMADV